MIISFRFVIIYTQLFPANIMAFVNASYIVLYRIVLLMYEPVYLFVYIFEF